VININKKIIFLIIFSFLLIALTAWAKQIFFIKVNQEKLRIEPNGRAITTLPKDTQVEVIGSTDRWIKVKVEGWISKESISNNLSEDTDGETINPGFVYKDIKLRGSNGRINITGKLTNQTGKDYQSTTFIIKLYNNLGSVIGTNYIQLNNFADKQTKSFKLTTAGYLSQVKDYVIKFESGI